MRCRPCNRVAVRKHVSAPFWCPTPCSRARSARGSLRSCLALVVAWRQSKEAFLCRRWRGRARGHRRGPWPLSFVAEPAQRSLPTTETQTSFSRSEPASNQCTVNGISLPDQVQPTPGFHAVTRRLGFRWCSSHLDSCFKQTGCVYYRGLEPRSFATEDCERLRAGTACP
jgi:hypothetical protein